MGVLVGAAANQLATHKDSIGANSLGLRTIRVATQRHSVQRAEPQAAMSLPHTPEIQSQLHSTPTTTPSHRMVVVCGRIHGDIHAKLTPWVSSAKRTQMALTLREAFGLLVNSERSMNTLGSMIRAPLARNARWMLTLPAAHAVVVTNLKLSELGLLIFFRLFSLEN